VEIPSTAGVQKKPDSAALSFPSPACGRGQGEGTRVKRFHEIALTPALSRERERGKGEGQGERQGARLHAAVIGFRQQLRALVEK